MFEDDQDEARDHVLEQHLDLIETEFEDLMDFYENIEEEYKEGLTSDEIYEEAVDVVVGDLLDEIIESES